MKPGTQVIYIPSHVQGKADRVPPGRDCMHGFIASDHQLGQGVVITKKDCYTIEKLLKSLKTHSNISERVTNA